jgi:hypothetical protein
MSYQESRVPGRPDQQRPMTPYEQQREAGQTWLRELLGRNRLSPYEAGEATALAHKFGGADDKARIKQLAKAGKGGQRSGDRPATMADVRAAMDELRQQQLDAEV